MPLKRTDMTATAPHILIDVNNNGTHYRWATADLYLEDVEYTRRIPDKAAFDQELTELFYGRTEHSDISIPLLNIDGTLTAVWQGDPDRLRTATAAVYLYDFGPSTPVKIHEMHGKITEFSAGVEGSITVKGRDPQSLQALLPPKVFSTDDFPGAAESDLGKAIPIPVGRCRKVPLLHVLNDTDNDYYDYLLGFGQIESNNTNKEDTVNVYRDGVLVDPVEYTVYDGSQGSPYPGYAFIRFVLEQRNFQGKFHALTADFYGLLMGGAEARRHFVRVIENLLSDSTYGLGHAVNAASFNTAAGYAFHSSMYCDGAIVDQQPAQDYLNNLLLCCRAWLSKNSDNEWVITCDGEWDDTSAANFGYRDEHGLHNIISYEGPFVVDAEDAVQKVVANYAFNRDSNKYEKQIERAVSGRTYGKEIVLDLPFVGIGSNGNATADRVAQYHRNVNRYSEDRLKITVGEEGRGLDAGDKVTVDIPQFASAQLMRVVGVNRSMDETELELCSVSSDIYDFSAGSYSPSAGGDDPTDYSLTAPGAPINEGTINSTTYQSTDGTTCAKVDLYAQPADKNFSRMEFGYKLTSQSHYTIVAGKQSGNYWYGRVEGMVPGQDYDFLAIAWNKPGTLSTGGTAITGWAAPGDSSAPATPTGLTLSVGIKSITLTWDQNQENDLKGYDVERWPNANGIGQWGLVASVAASAFQAGEDSGSPTYVDKKITQYGVTHYYRVRARDFSGNASGYTSNVSGKPQQVDTDDMADGAVTDGKVNDVSFSKVTAGTLAANVSITLNSGATPAKLIFDGSCEMYGSTSVSHMHIIPYGSVATYFLGNASNHWNIILGYALTNISFFINGTEKFKVSSLGVRCPNGTFVTADGKLGQTQTVSLLTASQLQFENGLFVGATY